MSAAHIKQNIRQQKFPLLQANEMYKAAFLVKKTKFKHQYPERSETEIHKLTISYFQNLSKD